MHPNHHRPGPAPARPVSAMMGLLLGLCLLIGGCGLGGAVSNYMDSKDSGLLKRLAVAPFTSGVASQKERAAAMQKALMENVAKSGGVVVSDFTAVQAEMAKVPRGITSQEDRAMEAGRQLGVNALLAANITDLSVQRMLKGIYGMRDNRPFLNLEIELRMVDVTTGTVMGQSAFKRQEQIDDTVAEAIEAGGLPDDKILGKLTEELLKESSAWVSKQMSTLPWGGTVLEVESNRVLVNIGQTSGLPAGSVLTVYALGERIKAGTGQELALTGPRVGRIKLGQLGERQTWAEIVERAGESKEALEAAKKAKEAKEKEAAEKKDKGDGRMAMEEKPELPTKKIDFTPGQVVRTH